MYRYSFYLQKRNLLDIFEIFIRFQRFYRAKLDFIAANDPYRADKHNSQGLVMSRDVREA